MKKSLLVSMTIFTIMTGYSQTEKGKKLISGQFNLFGGDKSNSNSNSYGLYKSDNNSSRFQIVPSFGYFVKDNFAVGANLNFGASNSTSTQDNEYPNQLPSKRTNKSNSISYGIGGFARYYKKITDNFLFFVNGGVSYTYQKQKWEFSNNDPNYVFSADNPAVQEGQTNTISFAASPGLVYFITPKLGIETNFGSLYYSNSSSKNITLPNDNHSNTNNYGINLNVSSFYFGLSYYF